MKTIAIIEDDQPIGDLLEEALGQAGYATLRAYSGTEAQYLLERAKPDLILLGRNCCPVWGKSRSLWSAPRWGWTTR